MWDVSGDRGLYEGTWPAIMHGAMGVVYVYDATKVGEEKDLEQWWVNDVQVLLCFCKSHHFACIGIRVSFVSYLPPFLTKYPSTPGWYLHIYTG